MFVGKVIGTVWSTVKWEETRGLKLLLVRPYHLGDLLAREQTEPAAAPPATSGPGAGADKTSRPLDSEAVVCVDLLDAGVGDDVIVAFGHAARVAAQATESRSEGTGGARGSAQFSTVTSSSRAPAAAPTAGATVPIDAAVVAIVDRIALARPGT